MTVQLAQQQAQCDDSLLCSLLPTIRAHLCLPNLERLALKLGVACEDCSGGWEAKLDQAREITQFILHHPDISSLAFQVSGSCICVVALHELHRTLSEAATKYNERLLSSFKFNNLDLVLFSTPQFVCGATWTEATILYYGSSIRNGLSTS